METAIALGDWLAASPRDMCAIVLGDFNAEPFELPFGDFGLCSQRHLGRGLRLVHPSLYNTAWRFLAEPDLCETIAEAGDAYAASRPKTTYDSRTSDSVLFDQLLVSGRALRGGPIALREGSVAYACDDRIGYRENGYPRPKRWTFHAGVPSGASDHFPLIATFDTPLERGGTRSQDRARHPRPQTDGEQS